jgi:hypothetical protein
MTELALKLWPLLAGDTPTGVRGWEEDRRQARGWKEKRRPPPPFRDPELTAALGDAIRSLGADAEVWKRGTEQARLELLVDALYQRPLVAQLAQRKLRDALDYEGPRFIRELALLVLTDGKRERKPPPSTRELEECIDKLLGNPDLVVEQAEKYRIAVPFTLVLHRELKEITASRARRLARDPETEILRLKGELENANRTLTWHRQTKAKRRKKGSKRVGSTADTMPSDALPDEPESGVPVTQEDELEWIAYAVSGKLDQLLEQQRMSPDEPPGPPLRTPPDSPPPPVPPPADAEPAPPGGGPPTTAGPTTTAVPPPLPPGAAGPPPAPPASAGGAGAAAPPPSGTPPPTAPPPPGEPPLGPTRHPLRAAQTADLVGLALSGGGIRSATFNLGVLQALADLDLLRRLDYVSSVSGGGYIASWLTAWSKRCVSDGIRTVQRCLSPARSPDPRAEGLRPIRWLREYSNYLTPKAGFLSADTWTMVTTWLRNTLLNQTVLVLLFAAVLLIPRAVAPLLFLETPTPWALRLAAVLLACSSIFIGLNLRRFGQTAGPGPAARRDFTSQGRVQWTVVVPSFLAMFLLTKPLLEDAMTGRWSLGWAVLALCLFLIQVFSGADLSFYPPGTVPRWWRRPLAFLAMAITSAVSALAGAAVLWFFAHTFAHWSRDAWHHRGVWHAITFGPPLLILSFFLITTTHLGLLGRNLPDERREWWSRLGAWSLIYCLGWLALCATSIYGPWGLAKLGVWLSAAAAGWVATTAGGVLAARSAQQDGATTPSVKLPARLRFGHVLALVGPYVFILGLFVAIAFGLHRLILRLDPVPNVSGLPSLEQLSKEYWTYTLAGHYRVPLLLLGIAALGALVLAWRVDVNEFSMHHFYKNRLARCYLGASRPPGARHANRFTGFDRNDDLSLARLRMGGDNGYLGPYPIINTALNLVKGENLAWQERKASSFVFTPWYSGYEYVPVNTEVAENPAMSSNGYRLTDEYGYREGGIALGTAAAISGAAANPNMGYHSAPAASFLLTVFNARLGWWLGNPRAEATWRSSSPWLGLIYHFNELAGNTSDRSGFVNLSDGGHFDNLGIYELVRRRCGYIIACDAEQDAAVDFGGLGNVIRKCRVDFGVDIVMAPDRIRIDAGAGRSQVHCVVGTVTYPDNRAGKLLYIKASLTGDEPADVIEYQRRQPIFPHQTTGDQWFDESQFESYRVLGHHSATVALRQAAEALTSVDPLNGCVLPDPLFQYLESLWYPPSAAIEAHFTQHSAGYDTLLDRVRGQTGLIGLDKVLFQDPQQALADPPPPTTRDTFYTLVAMISLMQGVFLDLDLENNGSHPHNAGWVRIFHRWAADQEFRKAWEVTKESCGERFRRFCEAELNLPR